MLRKITTFCGLALFIITAVAITSPALAGDIANDINAIANGEHRSEKNRARNQFRHPGETLEFFGINSNMTVVEISPGGGGWYTEILAPYLKAQGKYYVGSYEEDADNNYQQRTAKRYNSKLEEKPDVYGDVIVGVFAAPDKLTAAPESSADMVLTFRNTHNWVGSGNQEAAMKAMYSYLKPGGVLGMVQHRGNENHTSGDEGYLHEDLVIKMAQSVGFTLEAKSEINANSKDTKDHPKGVWNLPPGYQDGDKDRAKYTAIGESDRMTLKFRKHQTD